MDLTNLSRQRIDYETLPNGAIRAVLTITLPEGHVRRFTSTLQPGSEVGRSSADPISPTGKGISLDIMQDRKATNALPDTGDWPPYDPKLDRHPTAKWGVHDYVWAGGPFHQAFDYAITLGFANTPGRSQPGPASWARRVPAPGAPLPPKAMIMDYVDRHWKVQHSLLHDIAQVAVSVAKVALPIASILVPALAPLAIGINIAPKLVSAAKKLAAGNVMAAAADGLAAGASAVGVSPAVKAASHATASVLGVGAKLQKAASLAEFGQHAQARAFVALAKGDANALSKSPQAAASLLAAANAKRLAVGAVAEGRAPAFARAQAKPVNVMEAAHAGQLRSNRPGAITPAALLTASRAGRVYWIAS